MGITKTIQTDEKYCQDLFNKYRENRDENALNDILTYSRGACYNHSAFYKALSDCFSYSRNNLEKEKIYNCVFSFIKTPLIAHATQIEVGCHFFRILSNAWESEEEFFTIYKDYLSFIKAASASSSKRALRSIFECLKTKNLDKEKQAIVFQKLFQDLLDPSYSLEEKKSLIRCLPKICEWKAIEGFEMVEIEGIQEIVFRCLDRLYSYQKLLQLFNDGEIPPTMEQLLDLNEIEKEKILSQLLSRVSEACKSALIASSSLGEEP